MSCDPCPDSVRDEFVSLPVPGEQDRAGTASPVNFGHPERLTNFRLRFVLKDAGRPQQPHGVDFGALSQSGDDGGGALSKVSGGTLDLPFLTMSSGEDFHFGADGALAVV